jgi:hypothetical protein
VEKRVFVGLVQEERAARKEKRGTEGERGEWTMGEQTMTLTFGPFSWYFSFFEPCWSSRFEIMLMDADL